MKLSYEVTRLPGVYMTAKEAATAFSRHAGLVDATQTAHNMKTRGVTSDEAALEAARSEGLNLPVAKTASGYVGVSYQPYHCKSRPYKAQLSVNNFVKSLGTFACAAEAALAVARARLSSEGCTRPSAAAQPARAARELTRGGGGGTRG